MKKLSVEILPNKIIHAKWEEPYYNALGEMVGFGNPVRRALTPDSLADRAFVEQEGGELEAYANIAWKDLPWPAPAENSGAVL